MVCSCDYYGMKFICSCIKIKKVQKTMIFKIISWFLAFIHNRVPTGSSILFVKRKKEKKTIYKKKKLKKNCIFDHILKITKVCWC